MEFKKISHLIWMVLALLFIIVLFLHVYSEIIQIEKLPNAPAYIKFNKLTGKIFFVRFTKDKPVHKWQSVETLSDNPEKDD